MKKTTFLLLTIISVAVFLRFYQINTNPKSMYGDGITLVYDAYSILKTGHDQKGEFMPMVFFLGGDRPAGYVYATVPFTALFGPTALASGMVSALSGIGIVILLYLLGKYFLSQKAGLVIATIAAINPWELSLSRGPFEAHFALFLTLFGFYFFLRGFKKTYWFIFFGLSFALAAQTYSTYKLTIPLFTILLLIWTGKKLILEYISKPVFMFSLAVIFASTMLALYLTISQGSKDRFNAINIFNNQDIRHSISQKVKAARLLDSLSPAISNKLHTPHMGMAGVLAENYIRNFFPDFLFLYGDKQPRHNPAGMGEFFWIDIFLLILGLIYLYKKHLRLLIFLTVWIIIAPIPTSLIGDPHALRSSFLLPPLLLITGIGLWRLLSNRKVFPKSLLLILLGLVLVFQFILFIDRFYFIAPQKNARFWSYPAWRATQIASKNLKEFDFIILSNDIDNMEYAYPVYNKIDPNLVIQQNKSRTKIGEYLFFKYDNVYIGSLPNSKIMQFIKDLPGSVLYIGSEKEQSYLDNNRILRGFDGTIDLTITAKGKALDF